MRKSRGESSDILSEQARRRRKVSSSYIEWDGEINGRSYDNTLEMTKVPLSFFPIGSGVSSPPSTKEIINVVVHLDLPRASLSLSVKTQKRCGTYLTAQEFVKKRSLISK